MLLKESGKARGLGHGSCGHQFGGGDFVALGRREGELGGSEVQGGPMCPVPCVRMLFIYMCVYVHVLGMSVCAYMCRACLRAASCFM